MEYERGRSLSLHGAGFALADAVNLVNALQKAGLFQSVELLSSNARSLQGRDVVEFQIECRFPRASAS